MSHDEVKGGEDPVAERPHLVREQAADHKHIVRRPLAPLAANARGLSTVEAIKSYILERGLQPGDTLPTENQLCTELGVSRSSVREAIRTLVSLDIVDVQHGRGTSVGQLSLSPLINGLVFRSLLNHDGACTTLLEVVELRESLDIALTDQLVSAYAGARHVQLHRLAADMKTLADNGESFMETDCAFHTVLLGGLGNRLIQQLVAALWEVHTSVVPQLGIAQPADIVNTVAAHADMLEALEAGDADAYRRAVGQHYEPLRRSIERVRANESMS